MKIEKTYFYYLVLYVDILGITRLLESIKGLPTTDEDNARYIDTIVRVETFMRSFRRWPEMFLLSWQKERPIPDFVPADKHDEYRRMTTTNVKHQYLSDFQVSYVTLRADDMVEHFRALAGIYSIIGYSGLLFLYSLSKEFPLRGGIGIETGFEIQDREIFGPALTRAYQLESRLAVFPRIVVGDEVVEHLNAFRAFDSNDSMAQACQNMVSEIGKMLVRDVDGYVIIDFLGAFFRDICFATMNKEIDGIQYSYEGVLREAFSFVKREYSKMAAAKETKTAYGYLGLMNYFHHKLNEDERLKSILDI